MSGWCVGALALLLATAALPAVAQVNVPTSQYNNQRTNVNSSELVLAPANVNSTTFGKQFSQTVDGYVYAQPLYVANMTIGGVTHNVVYVATEHDSVYAFDADSNTGPNSQPLWKTSFLSPGVTTVPSSILTAGNTDIIPEIGITGTPAIDLSTLTLFVVAETLENNGSSFVKKLHALDLATGSEKPGSPISISASVTVPGQSAVTLDIGGANQRAGLLLYNGVIYIGLGAHGDGTTTVRGWILGYSYNGSSFSQVFVYCTEPSSVNGWAGGIWMTGQGLAMDSGSNIFVATGNGTFDTKLQTPVNYGDSIIRIDLANGPTVQDYFTPSDQADLVTTDLDLGSGGLAILPDQPGPNPHLLVQAGKPGTIYVVNRDNMGHFNSSHDNIVQELPALNSVFSSPVYFNGKVYYWVYNDFAKAFTVTNGMLSTTPTDVGDVEFGWPGATPTISANGTSNAILWALKTDAFSDAGPGGPTVLYAYDAGNLSAGPLYNSSQNSTRDNPGSAIKLTVPTVANGKVYVGAVGQLSVFGLLGNSSARITSATSTTFTVSTPGTFTVTTTGVPTPSVAETGALPSGVTFTDNGNGTATLGGTPAAGTAGSYVISITANNGVGSPANQTFTLSVNTTQAPTITSVNSTTFTVSTPGTFTVTTTGVPTPTLTETGALPSGVTFTDNGNGTATLGGAPAAGTAGSYPITIKAHNGVGTDASQAFTLTVNGGTGGSSFAYVNGSVTGAFNAGGGGSTTLSVHLHQNPGAGHLLLCAATWQSSTATASMTDPNNGTWTAIGSASRGIGGLVGYSGQIFYIPSAVGASTNVTLNVSTAVVFRSLECAEYSYTGTISSLDGTPQYSTTPASGGVATIGGLTTLNSGDLVFAACLGVDTICSAGSGYTLHDDANSLNAGNGSLGNSFLGNTGQTIEERIGVAAGAQTATFGTGTNIDNVILGLLAVKAAPPTSTPPAITSSNSVGFTIGTPGSFSVTTTGTPTPSLTETGALPSGVTFTDNGNGTATLGGTPAAGTAG
ncbi:MAG TPA: hypothetical protein VKB49_12450, partial [Candidatus Sulfotelmatobacter sp.]|nr:hypothetical protein [Candidatus Sulfotelmatobacter sp.]